MAVTAITGDIGAGKSSAAKIAARLLGCRLLDADVTAHSLWEREDVKSMAVKRWGSGILDAAGHVIRPEVAKRIFSVKSEHDFCNGLLHPIVMQQLRERSQELQDVVIEIPLLPEVGRPDWIDTVIYITANFETRAERCSLQRGWSREELIRRESFLLPQAQRISISDYTIHNESNISELEKQTGEIIAHENKRSSGEKKYTR